MSPEKLTAEQIERFWGRVQKSDGCWVWMGKPDKDGYGIMRIGGRKAERAHRLSWIIDRGPIPEGLWVLHHCDNPTCVRPDHLFLGTAMDNAVDCNRKGRRRPSKGEDCYNAKLSKADVAKIVKEYIPIVMTQDMLAKKYGVSQATISHVLRGGHWKHVDRKTVRLPRTVTHASCPARAKKISAEIAAKIRAAYVRGKVSQQSLADRFGIAQTMVSNIIIGKNW